jgi:hypothetical protein
MGDLIVKDSLKFPIWEKYNSFYESNKSKKGFFDFCLKLVFNCNQFLFNIQIDKV